ncbi:outer membrane protein assembly factor BamE domain-containing protein [Pseudomonas donghuensis]|uniref:outer membrane protein assembly factor BamE domain-containing protein n=1 Tax=Pseudomonas donghuensis TaxID=1163398 RepID=UPI00215F6B35|nr:outer membrane protein assembly factor BamE [Pseudomonas donghuensis]UVL26835.1 outer membrane protein assembly factor BamE [Pseudomonas donghuensis]
MRKFVAVVALAAVLGGCAGTNFTYDQARQVKVGMTEDQVVELMGPPYSVVSRADGQMWIWSYANGMSGASRVVSFRMVDGKVVEVPIIPTSFE